MKKILIIIVLYMILTGCAGNAPPVDTTPSEETVNVESPFISIPVGTNPYFFPDGLQSIEVVCKLHKLHWFEGKATLQINKLTDTKLGGYYELRLTDLNGKCDGMEGNDECDGRHSSANDYKCEFIGASFAVGYFYADSEYIYYIFPDKEYLEIFKETEVFPPADEEIWYRLVCSEEGFENTFDPEEDYHTAYHNYIAVMGDDNDERHYYLYPESFNTREYMTIFWKKGVGMTYFGNWTGAGKGLIEFAIPQYEDIRTDF